MTDDEKDAIRAALSDHAKKMMEVEARAAEVHHDFFMTMPHSETSERDAADHYERKATHMNRYAQEIEVYARDFALKVRAALGDPPNPNRPWPRQDDGVPPDLADRARVAQEELEAERQAILDSVTPERRAEIAAFEAEMRAEGLKIDPETAEVYSLYCDALDPYCLWPAGLTENIGREWATETEGGKYWAESRLKELTGGERVAARFMHKDFFEYLPQFKPWISGNHKRACARSESQCAVGST